MAVNGIYHCKGICVSQTHLVSFGIQYTYIHVQIYGKNLLLIIVRYIIKAESILIETIYSVLEKVKKYN
jgi:hypothetical protein